MIKRLAGKFSCIFIFIFFFNPLQSQLLWEISGNGLEKSSYLFGTAHLMDQRAFEFNDSVFAKIDACEAFAMELIPTPEIQKQMENSLYLKNGKTYQDIFSKEDYDFVSDFFQKNLEIKFEAFENMNPLILSFIILYADMENDMEDVVDDFLYEYAKSKNKKTLNVEAIETHEKVMEIYPPEAILSYLKNWDAFKLATENMVIAYQKEELEKVFELTLKDKNLEKIIDPLLYDRNISMADSIENFMHRQPTFIAVGAAHLPKKKGVIELLQKRGYQVKPIFAPKTKTLPTLQNTDSEDFTNWKLINVKRFNFEIQFPDKPVYEVEEPEFEGDEPLFSILYEDDNASNSMYGIHISDFNQEKHVPSSKMSTEELERFYQANLDDAMEAIGAKVIRTENIQMDGKKAKSVDASFLGGLLEFKYVILYHEFQLFIFQIMSDKKMKKNKGAAYFLNSFKMK